jgi:D-sedoheptulose 7-phosphate isomerase
MHDALVRARIAESIETKQAMLHPDVVEVTCAIAGLMTDALRAGRKVFLCGNGGSAADATHLAAELVGRYLLDRDPMPAISLCENTSSLTSIANDYEYVEVFSRQVRGLGQPGDVLVAMSTSGNSPNVLAAVEAANALGLRTIGMTARDGGRLADLVEVCLRVPADDTARAQEGGMLVGHTVCELVEQALCAAPARTA